MDRTAVSEIEVHDHSFSALRRREFIKGIALIGAGISSSPLLAETESSRPQIPCANSGAAKEPKATDISGPEPIPTRWHGFRRYDFVLDEDTLKIAPFKAPANEGDGIAAPDKGTRRCVLVKPDKAAPGKPWSWRGCYWNHQPQTEMELLRRGFHIAYISADANLKPDGKWDAWYAYLTARYGLSAKPAFIGMSRGGQHAYTWATRNPDKVSCIYADNPAVTPESQMGLLKLADCDVPLLHVCGSIDPLFGTNALTVEEIYRQFGGQISTMIKEGFGHHPHSLHNPQPLADFIEQSFNRPQASQPAFAKDPTYTKASYYYSTASSYREFPAENALITCRGPLFSGCYRRYAFNVKRTEGDTTVIAPKTAAAGIPWVFRAGFVRNDLNVDTILLERGYHIVTGPVGYNHDGPLQQDWDAVYKYLVEYGFSKRPVLEGTGGGAGEIYAWAISNPDKVAGIYAENPILQSHMAIERPLEELTTLAKAKVPIVHLCGGRDPAYQSNSRVVEERYKKLGGRIQVIFKPEEGHYPLGTADPVATADRLLRMISNS